MHLRKCYDKKGDLHLSITHCFRNEKGNNSSKTYKTFGKMSKLKKEWGMSEEEVLERCQKECDKYTEEYVNERRITIDVNLRETVKKDADLEKNYGCAVPLSFYNLLRIETTLRNFVKNKKIKYDINSITKLLVLERLLNPSSRLSAFENKNNYFFKTDFTLKDIYRSLDIICNAKDRIIASLNRNIVKNGYRSKSQKIFYDVTNYYFECEENEMLRFGCGKENRKNPIIQMGLLQDENAIPISYKLFSGNTNDCLTMLPVLQELKKQHEIGRVIVVADKGNNTSTNIAANYANGDGFIFSQSIRGTKSNKQLRDWVTDENDYEIINENFKMKSKQDWKEIELKAEDTFDGKVKTAKIPIKVVAFWSKKYEARSRQQRQKAIDKANEMIERSSKYISATNYGATRFVKDLVFDKKTGEVLSKSKLTFDHEKLAEEEKCDGYYCIITSETTMSDKEIIDTYHGLWQIEESFKITKSDLTTRPVYVRDQKHIEAHFLICYIALVIARVMQSSLRKRPSISRIIEEISACNAINAHTNLWVFGHRNSFTDELYKLANLGYQKRWKTLSDIKKDFGKSKFPTPKLYKRKQSNYLDELLNE